jgi:hypothetical protein
MCDCNNAQAASFQDPTKTIPYVLLAIGAVSVLAILGVAAGAKKRPSYVAARRDFAMRRALRVGKPVKL